MVENKQVPGESRETEELKTGLRLSSGLLAWLATSLVTVHCVLGPHAPNRPAVSHRGTLRRQRCWWRRAGLEGLLPKVSPSTHTAGTDADLVASGHLHLWKAHMKGHFGLDGTCSKCCYGLLSQDGHTLCCRSYTSMLRAGSKSRQISFPSLVTGYLCSWRGLNDQMTQNMQSLILESGINFQNFPVQKGNLI